MSFFARLFAPPTARFAPPLSETIDLEDPSVSVDPFPWYERLRSEGDVLHLSRHGFWIVLGYETVREVFARPDLFSSAPYEFVDTAMLSADPPRHGPVRRLVSRAFGGDMLRRLERLAAVRAEELIRPGMEIVAEYARPLSRAVAAELIGFDRRDVAAIALEEDEAAASGASDSFERICARLDALAPRAGMFAGLEGDESGLVGADEARSLVRLLWLASTATTERTIAHAVYRLACDSALHRRLREEPDRIAAFVEEVVRLNPPENLIRRRALADTSLAGAAIKQGAEVNLCLPAANRDPHFFETPAALRLDRDGPANLSFGSGIHFCVGAPLTRRVVAAAVAAVVRSSEGPRLAGEVEWVHAMIVRAPRTLPVAL
ncbi:MAG TPA: cytochrome P450 [Allosphingosinicella sp.]|nr:cytochrome P450 [Allosphingosinicella sp.]